MLHCTNQFKYFIILITFANLDTETLHKVII